MKFFYLCWALVSALPPVFAAQAPDLWGYVVRVDSPSVYLDFGAGPVVSSGDRFEIYRDSGSLVNPVTGRSLGPLETAIAQGRIRDVFPSYSVGRLISWSSWPRVGEKARMRFPEEPQEKAASQPAVPAFSQEISPQGKSAVLNFTVRAMAVGNFDKSGSAQIALAAEGKIYFYSYPAADAKPLDVYDFRSAATKLVALETLVSSGSADGLLAVRFDPVLGRLSTSVLKREGGDWREEQEISGAVRPYQAVQGPDAFGVQELREDAAFLFSPIEPIKITFESYRKEKPYVHPPDSEWLYDSTEVDLDKDRRGWLTLTPADRLKIKFGSDSWVSDEAFGQTPVRIRWQNNPLEFHPRIPVDYEGSRPCFYAVHNIPLFNSSLAAALGHFRKGEIRKECWQGDGLKEKWKAPVQDGYVSAIGMIDQGPEKKLAAAVVRSSGSSLLYFYEP